LQLRHSVELRFLNGDPDRSPLVAGGRSTPSDKSFQRKTLSLHYQMPQPSAISTNAQVSGNCVSLSSRILLREIVRT
jgi:hypothetical protein